MKKRVVKVYNALTWCIFLNKWICLCKAERWWRSVLSEAVKQFWSFQPLVYEKTGNTNLKLLVFTIKMNLRLIKLNIFQNCGLFWFTFYSCFTAEHSNYVSQIFAAQYLKVNTKNEWGFLLQTLSNSLPLGIWQLSSLCRSHFKAGSVFESAHYLMWDLYLLQLVGNHAPN